MIGFIQSLVMRQVDVAARAAAVASIKLTENFGLDEFIVSETAIRYNIDNSPTSDVIANLQALCENALQPLRDHLGAPIQITSGYRSPELNRRVGGSKRSQHVYGQAADFRVAPQLMRTAFDHIRKHLIFDQLINEYGLSWIHVSYTKELKNRRSVLAATKTTAGRTRYTRIG